MQVRGFQTALEHRKNRRAAQAGAYLRSIFHDPRTKERLARNPTLRTAVAEVLTQAEDQLIFLLDLDGAEWPELHAKYVEVASKMLSHYNVENERYMDTDRFQTVLSSIEAKVEELEAYYAVSTPASDAARGWLARNLVVTIDNDQRLRNFFDLNEEFFKITTYTLPDILEGIDAVLQYWLGAVRRLETQEVTAALPNPELFIRQMNVLSKYFAEESEKNVPEVMGKLRALWVTLKNVER